MGIYIKFTLLVVACFLLGTVALALLPFLTVLGLGALFMFLIYCMVQASKMDIDAEVSKLKEKHRSK